MVVARAAAGIVLVFNRYRSVWELPGGLIDPGESHRQSAQRELAEEAGCEADTLDWLGIIEVDDGRGHFGAVFACEVASGARDRPQTRKSTDWPSGRPPLRRSPWARAIGPC